MNTDANATGNTSDSSLTEEQAKQAMHDLWEDYSASMKILKKKRGEIVEHVDQQETQSEIDEIRDSINQSD